jgi:hypothetical protein
MNLANRITSSAQKMLRHCEYIVHELSCTMKRVCNISAGSISKDKGNGDPYQKHRLAILSRLRLGIQIVVRIAVENRGFVGDARVPRGINWLDRHDAMQRSLHFFGACRDHSLWL